MWHSLQFGVCQDCAKNDSWLSSRKPRLAKVPISFKKNGAPDRIRTCDLCLRRAALYPAELRVPVTVLMTSARGWIQKRAGICKAVPPGLPPPVAMAGIKGRAVPPVRPPPQSGGDADPEGLMP